MAAPLGNNNGSKGKDWLNAVRYAIATYQDDQIKRGFALKAIALRVVKDALEGKHEAWREISERLDGKVAPNGNGNGAVKVLILRDNGNAIACNAIEGELIRTLPAPDDE